MVNRNGSSIEGIVGTATTTRNTARSMARVVTPRVKPLVVDHSAGGATGVEVPGAPTVVVLVLFDQLRCCRRS